MRRERWMFGRLISVTDDGVERPENRTARPQTAIGRRRLAVVCFECEQMKMGIWPACAALSPEIRCACAARTDAAGPVFVAHLDDPAAACPHPECDKWASIK